MPLRKPTRDDFRCLAHANHFELSAEEAEAYEAMLPDMFAALDALDQAPANLPEISYREREPGSRPSRADDPLNAIVRRCSIKGASSGKLAGKRLGIKDNVSICRYSHDVCLPGAERLCAGH